MLRSMLNKSDILKSVCSFLCKKEFFIKIVTSNISNSVDLDIVRNKMKFIGEYNDNIYIQIRDIHT